jgi:hypothetical protein
MGRGACSTAVAWVAGGFNGADLRNICTGGAGSATMGIVGGWVGGEGRGCMCRIQPHHT